MLTLFKKEQEPILVSLKFFTIWSKTKVLQADGLSEKSWTKACEADMVRKEN